MENNADKKILIVEDDFSSMYMLSFLLRTYEYEVYEAIDGEQGLKMAKKLKPYVILLDIQMPKMDGLELTRILKNDEEFKSIPIIILTSFARAEDKERALQAGADGYMDKPINPDVFIPYMEAVVKAMNLGNLKM
jgi:CheY-like chemotaxis protein